MSNFERTDRFSTVIEFGSPASGTLPMRLGPCRGEELPGTSAAKGVCAKWRTPLVRALASMQNLESAEKIKPGQTWKVFSSVLGQVANRLHKVAVSLCGNRPTKREVYARQSMDRAEIHR